MLVNVNAQLDPVNPAAVALEDAPGLVLAALGGDPAVDECQVQAQRAQAAAVGGEAQVVGYSGLQLSVQIALGADEHIAWSGNEAAALVAQALGGKLRQDYCTLAFSLGEAATWGTPPAPPDPPPA